MYFPVSCGMASLRRSPVIVVVQQGCKRPLYLWVISLCLSSNPLYVKTSSLNEHQQPKGDSRYMEEDQSCALLSCCSSQVICFQQAWGKCRPCTWTSSWWVWTEWCRVGGRDDGPGGKCSDAAHLLLFKWGLRHCVRLPGVLWRTGSPSSSDNTN